jgi:pyocin large subunit-like protein
MPGFLDQNDYVSAARELLAGPAGEGVIEGMRANGDLLRFGRGTQAFGIKSPAGTAKTFFRPDDGESYFWGPQGLNGANPC